MTTTSNRIEAVEMIRSLSESAPGDPIRAILESTVEPLMSAEASALCGAGHRERSDTRSNVRNGYRERQWDRRVGSIDLVIPKLREGSDFPEWLLEPRRRAEQALWTVVATAYLEGVSTRNVDKLCKSLGINALSRSQVSRMAATLDTQVAAFRERKLDGGYRYVWVDALAIRVREAGEVVNAALQFAVGVYDQGQRKVLGVVTRHEIGTTNKRLAPRIRDHPVRIASHRRRVCSLGPVDRGGLDGVPGVGGDRSSRSHSTSAARTRFARDRRGDGTRPQDGPALQRSAGLARDRCRLAR
jgi:transposase-like protein